MEIRHLASAHDEVGLEHSGRHGEQRDCVQPADFTFCLKSPVVALSPQKD